MNFHEVMNLQDRIRYSTFSKIIAKFVFRLKDFLVQVVSNVKYDRYIFWK